jgi:hypothetical protein
MSVRAMTTRALASGVARESTAPAAARRRAGHGEKSAGRPRTECSEAHGSNCARGGACERAAAAYGMSHAARNTLRGGGHATSSVGMSKLPPPAAATVLPPSVGPSAFPRALAAASGAVDNA